MKTLLNKKLIALIIAVVLCFTTTNAQIPNHLLDKKKGFYSQSYQKTLEKINALSKNDKVPCLKKQTSLGGTGDDFGNKMIRTGGSGFVVAGATNSGDGDFKVPAAHGEDAFIAKYNNFNQLEWTKTFGGTGDDVFNDIAQTNDGGYIVAGYTSSNDGDISGNHGGYDVLVVKFSASGNMEWQKCFGGSGDDLGTTGLQTFYGGYAIAGYANSTDGDISGIHGDFDAWVGLLDPKGDLLSQHCYGGSGFDYFTAIVTSDVGSLILQGATYSNDGDVSGNHGGQDVWVVKTNLSGNIIWQKTIGGSSDEYPSNNIAKTTDGNIVIDGGSFSTDGDINAKGTVVSFITKLNSSTGSIIWSKSYDKPNKETGYRAGLGIFATKDGGTVETGVVGLINEFSTFDDLVSKFDVNGNEEWYKVLGGSNFDEAQNGGFESANGNLIILGLTASTDGDVKSNHGGTDEWLIKLGPCGEDLSDDAVSTDKKTISSVKNNITLLSNYPNPFSNSTNISFSIPQSQKVSIQIFDGTGRLVKTIANAQMEAGAHQLNWNAAGVAKGIYYLKLNAGNYAETKKLSVVK